jgi:hypothetical protein
VRWVWALQLALALVFTVSWFLTPAWIVASTGYSVVLTPLGFIVRFLDSTMTVTPPTVYTIIPLAIASGLTPLLWRGRYVPYLGLTMAVLSIAMLVVTIMFQQRYLQFQGFIVAPTPNGYLYISLPPRLSIGVPVFILLCMIAPPIIAITKGNEDGGASGSMHVVTSVLKALGVRYRIDNGWVIVGGLRLTEWQDGSIIIMRGSEDWSELTFTSLEGALIEVIKAALRQGVVKHEAE